MILFLIGYNIATNTPVVEVFETMTGVLDRVAELVYTGEVVPILICNRKKIIADPQYFSQVWGKRYNNKAVLNFITIHLSMMREGVGL